MIHPHGDENELMGEHAHCSSIPNPEQAQDPVFSILIDLKTIYHCNYILHKLYTVYTYWLIGRRWSDCWSNNFEEILVFRDSWWTRLHSSRMRTGRSLTVCCSFPPGGGLLGPGGFSLVPGGFSLVPGGFSLVGGVLLGPGGFSLVPGGCLPGPGGDSPETPPVDRITDTCKNITLATTSLRPVINAISPVSYLIVLCCVSARRLTITNITFFKCFP